MIVRIGVVPLLLVAAVGCSSGSEDREVTKAVAVESPYGMCVMSSYGGEAELMKAFPRQLQLIKPAGIGFVRVPMYFHWTHPNAQTWDFSRFDRVMRDLEGTDVRPLCELSHIWRPNPKEKAPWAWPAYEHLNEWRMFVTKAVERYHDRVKHWEIWNEPNIEHFWHKPDPVRYWKVLDAAYRAIKAVDPEAVVTTAGFAGTPLDFIEELCRHERCFDAVVIHPYCDHDILNRPEDKIDADIDKLRELLAKYGFGSVPIWITEIGWPTEKDTPQTEGARWPVKPLVDALEKAQPKGRRMLVVSVEADSGKVDPGFVSLAQGTFGERVDAVGCAPGEVGAKLDAGAADILFWSFGYGYFDIDIAAVERFLAKGGTVVICGGTPLCCPFPRNEKGRFYRVPKSVEDYGDALSRRFRFHAPNLSWKPPVPKGLKVEGALVPHRYLTGSRLGPGDEFIPVLEATDETGRKYPVVATYRYLGGKKGNIIVSCVNNRFWHSVTEERQAKLLARTYGVMTAKNVEKMFWYTLILLEKTAWHSQDNFSIVHRDFSPKPAFGALQAFLAMRPAGSVQKPGAWHDADKTDYFPQWTLPDGTKAGMVWTLGYARTAELAFDSDRVEFFDLFGKPLNVKRGARGWLVPLSDAPVYFKGGHVSVLPR